MNKTCYRIIFNKSRQQLMAVAEFVSGQGKNGTRAGCNSRTTLPTSDMHDCGLLFKAVAIFTLMGLDAASFAADIIAAPNATAGKQPTVIQAPSGTPVVQIATPSTAGVSHNQYQQFNVPTGGAILNNSQRPASTQLAGYIDGNANLPGGSARIILNEVIAPNPSQLRGMLEVTGQKAEVIIANPWGISVGSGAGFINTSQATLTTGTPVLSNGALTGYQVRGGSVSIDGTADVSNLDSFTILSRALQVNAGLYASKLNVVLGSNQISKDTLQATPITGDNNAPALALDVAQLGGMYAGVIKLVGTEAGLGVNSRGQLIASQGMQLNSAGDLNLSGSTSAQGDLQLQAAGQLDNSGTTSATGSLSASAGGQALLNGTLSAGNNLAVVAATVSGNGTVASGGQPDGTLSGSGSLSITASQQLSHSGRLLGAGNTTLQSSRLTLDHATVSSLNGNTALNSQGDISTQSATVSAGNTLTLQTTTLLNNQQGVLSAQQFNVQAGSVNNQQGKLLALGNTGSSQLTAAQAMDNSVGGQIGSNGQLAVSSASLNNNTGTLSSAAALSVSSTGTIDNRQGTLAANALAVHAASLNNQGGKIAQLGTGQATINTGNGLLDNSQHGTLLSNGSLIASTGSLTNDGGILGAQGDVQLTTEQGLSNVGGTIASQQQLTVQAGNIDNSQGLLQAGSTLNLQAQSLSNSQGNIKALGSGQSQLTLQGAVQNNGTVSSNGLLSLTAASLDNTHGSISTQNNLAITTGQLSGIGTLASGNDLSLSLQSDFSNTSGSTILANRNLSISTSGDISNAGALQAANNLTLNSQTLHNSGVIQANDTLASTQTQSASNSASGVIAGQTVNLTAPTQTNQGLITGQALTLQGADLVNDGSTAAIASTGNLSLQLTNSINNTNGALITAEQDLAIGNATQPVSLLNNNQSTIQAGGNATVYATTFTNASNPVTVTQTSTSSSKNQTTVALPTACSQWTPSSGTDEQGNSTYECGSSFNYIGQLSFNNGTHVDSWQSYSVSTGIKGDPVTTTTYHYEKFTFIQDDPSSKTLTVRLDTLTTSSRNGSSWVFANWSNPDDPIWSSQSVQMLNRVVPLTTTQTIDYFNQSGTSYQYIPGYSPSSNLISALLQSRGASYVFAMVPGQINTINHLSDINGTPTPYRVSGNGLTFTAGSFTVQGRDTVAQINETNRLTNTTVTTDKANGTAIPARLLVGGNLNLNAQSITNQYSTIAAGNNLNVHGSTAINNIGQSLNQTTTADITSTFSIGDFNFDGSLYQTNSRNTTVQQIGSLDAIFAGNQTVSISAPSINNSTINPANIAASNGSAPTIVSNTQALVGNPVSGSFQLPSGGLFHTATAPGQHYLVETDPRFTQYASFISSDYMLSRLGYDPNIIQKRLGDGYYEQQLVSQTITKLTGQRFLTGDTSATQQYQALMNNGVQVAQQFQLSPGIALSAEQIARLTQPMVWLVTQHVDGQDVLVPTVYLPGNTPSMAGQGAVIGGTNMVLAANGSLSNSGTLQTTGGVLTAQAQNIAINGGVVKSDNAITLQASQNLTLASSSDQLGRTATISGGSALLQAGNDLTVSAAKVHAAGDATLTAGQNLNITGTQTTQQLGTYYAGSNWSQTKTNTVASTIDTGGNLQLAAGNDMNLKASTVASGGNLVAAASNTLNVQSTTDTTQQQMNGRSTGFTSRTDTLNSTSLTAKGDTTLAAGQSLNLTAAQVQGSGQTTVQAGQDINLNALATTQAGSNYRQNYEHSQSDTAQNGSALVGDNGLTIVAGQDIKTQGSLLNSTQGTATLAAGRDLQLGTSESAHSDYTKVVTHSSGFFSSSTTTDISSHDSTTLNSTQLAANQVNLQAGRDVVVTASNVNATGALNATAQRDIDLQAQTRKDASSYFHQEQKSGFSASMLTGIQFGSSQSQESDKSKASLQTGSTLSGQNVTLLAGRDAGASAATVLADQNLQVQAGRNVNILAATNTLETTHQASSSSTTLGLLPGAAPRWTMFGTTASKENGTQTSTTQSTSLLSANSGNLTVLAGADNQYTGTGQGNLLSQGANLQAKQTATLQGNAVTLDAISNQDNNQYHQETKSFTIGSQLSGSVGSVITSIYDAAQAARNTSNDRLQGALALKAGYDAYKLANGGVSTALKSEDTMNALNKASTEASKGTVNNNSAAFGVSTTVGSNSSSQDSSSSNTTQRGTIVQADTLNITATDGNLSATGAKLQATDINLSASKDILLQAATNTAEVHNKNESSNASAGATFGFGQQNGISFQVGVGQSQGVANGSETTYDNTLVTASNQLNLHSGNDTTLFGAQLAGKTVNADVGGKLAITTLQDQSQYESHQSSSGFDISVCVPPICYGQFVSGSVNLAAQDINHDYQSATGQSGIAAGSGGFNLNVAGNTSLTGAAITSQASAEHNTLTTGSLSYQDLDNHQNTEASASSVGLSYNGASSLMSNLASNAMSNVLGNLASGTGLPANGSESSQTKSVISPASVTISSGDASSKNAADTLTARDASTANGALTNTLTLQQAQQLAQEQSKARENAQAAALVGAVTTNVIGDIALQQKWAEGSVQKTLLHGLAGVIEAKLAGGNAAAGFAAGAVNEQLTPLMDAYLTSHGIMPNSDDYASLMKAGSTLAGAATGALVGGTTQSASQGAAIANIATTNNWLNHAEKQKLATASQQCASGDSKACATRDQLLGLSNSRDQSLANDAANASMSLDSAVMVSKYLLDQTNDLQQLHDEQAALQTQINTCSSVVVSCNFMQLQQQSNNINAQIAETQKEIATLNQIGNTAVTTNIQHEQGDASNNAFTFAAEITGAKALGNVVLDSLAALGKSGAFGTLTKTSGSESNAGKLVWSELGSDGKVLPGSAANPSVQSIVKQSASTVSPTVQAAQLRQAQMLQSDTGYNLSPIAWDSYPTIGRNGTYVTDQITINNYFGNISGVSSTTITKSQAAQIEVDMGLQPGSLQNGFKVRQVDSIQKMQPNSPLSGNEYFMGAGNHLPSGSPEMVIQSIPTTDTATVKTILNVKVQ